jgi:hypothetical protein
MIFATLMYGLKPVPFKLLHYRIVDEVDRYEISGRGVGKDTVRQCQ